MRPPLSSEARVVTALAAVLWLLGAAATFDTTRGKPAAITAVVGCGIMEPLITAVAVSFWRRDRRRR
ncbi:hypothetical protein ABZ479_21330 [Streptomyces sp. NPDC005722]